MEEVLTTDAPPDIEDAGWEKLNKAAGPNDIFPRVFKELSEIIFKPLEHILDSL